jgi:protein-tyrosine phosphatase
MVSPIRGLVPWQPGRNYAKCLGGFGAHGRHRAPAPDCFCGITVCPDRGAVVEYVRRFGYRGDRWVVGEVAYGGTIYPSPIPNDPPGTLRVEWAEQVGELHELDLEPERLEQVDVLFVCSGNRCRSPMAEVVARWYGLTAASAGTDGRIPWTEMHPAARTVLRERLYPLRPHRPRRVTAELVASAGVVVGMTARHARRAEELGAARTLAWDVPDPFAGGVSVHSDALDLIEDSMAQVRLATRL